MISYLKRCLNCMEEKNNAGPCLRCGFDSSRYHCPPHLLPPGTLLGRGRYLVGTVLGEGGFGITYVGFDGRLERKVAIKEYFPDGCSSRYCGSSHGNHITIYPEKNEAFFQKGLRNFLNEARILASLQSLPGIVQILEYFQENSTAYIVMEFAEGKTLTSILEEDGKRIHPQTVISMMLPVIRSLEKVHETGLIHRDISPDNLMVDPFWNVKLLDFGSARSFTNSKVMSVMLKQGYTPYEQYSEKGTQGPYTDVYSLCATMYQAITGLRPPDAMERVMNKTSVLLKTPSSLGIVLSRCQEEALMKGLEIYAADRWQSMAELENALTQSSGKDLRVKIRRLAVLVAAAIFLFAIVFPAIKNRDLQPARPLPQPSPSAQEEWENSSNADTAVFCDSNMERLIRRGLNLPKGEITAEDLAEITVLKISGENVSIQREGEQEAEEKPISYSAASPEQNQILSVEDLKWFSGLTCLELTGHNADRGFDSLTELTRLETLVLENHRISDVSFLSRLKNLKNLLLSGYEISDIRPLKNLTSLRVLCLVGMPLKDISPLSDLNNLTSLYIEKTLLKDLNPLSGLTGLSNLYLNYNEIEDIRPLSKLSGLSVLSLKGNHIEDTSPVSELKLQIFDVSENTPADAAENNGER